jgi:hypothetical protein
MCDEYENELVRMGLIEDARKFREERLHEHERALAAARNKAPRDEADAKAEAR